MSCRGPLRGGRFGLPQSVDVSYCLSKPMLVIEIHIGAFISAFKIHPEVVSIVDFELLARFRHSKSIPKENSLFLSASFISRFEVLVRCQ